jgi:hypothetical protein
MDKEEKEEYTYEGMGYIQIAFVLCLFWFLVWLFFFK